MKYEYKTTYGDAVYYHRSSDDSSEPSDPFPPDGDGWEMTGMAANDRHIFWSWKREGHFREKLFFIDSSGSMTTFDFQNAANYVASRRKEVFGLRAFSRGAVVDVDLERFLVDPENAVFDSGVVTRTSADLLPKGYRPPAGLKTVFMTDGDVPDDLKSCFDEIVIVRRP